MSGAYLQHIRGILGGIEADGLSKRERTILGPQGARVSVPGAAGGPSREVLNLCSNNYLGLANHPGIVRAAHAALERWGYGMASVRFICGTQSLHRELEARISAFLGTEDAILYSSCFDANGGVFETLLSAEDAVISDELNHASIIDGIRLSKARRYRYRNCDLGDLEGRLEEASSSGVRFKLVVTDGVFSMDGFIAPLKGICELADRHGALVMVDDSHGVGVLGDRGRGTPEHCGVHGRPDIISGTLGKALGGASGGYVGGRREIVELLRQRSRPYLFSNTLAPMIAAASLAAVDLVEGSPELRKRLRENASLFRGGLTAAGFEVRPGIHPIVPVILGEASRAQAFASRLLEKGIYASGFFYPVVPQGAARIRSQVSAAHSRADLDAAIAAFAQVKAELDHR